MATEPTGREPSWVLLFREYIPLMYTLQVVTPPSGEPVTTAELKAHLRLNTTAEDSLLSDFITTARTVAETYLRRPILTTSYRQWFETFAGPVYLIRGGVTAVTAVNYYDQTDTLVAWNSSNWDTDLTGLVPSVYAPAHSYPLTSTRKVPVGNVEYTAGWANAAAVPVEVKTAVRLLAAHYFANREAFQEKSLTELPMGFRAVLDQHRTGLVSQMGRDHEGRHHDNPRNPWGYPYYWGL